MQSLSSVLGQGGGVVEAEPSFAGKVMLWAGLLASILLMTWIARVMDVPSQADLTASILQQSDGVLALVVMFVAIAVGMFAAAALCGRFRGDAPVLCAAAGCAAISLRGGTMQDTLFAAQGPSVFVLMAFEVLLLFAGLLAAWLGLEWVRAGTFPISLGRAREGENGQRRENWDENALALFTHAAAMMALMVLLCRSDAKHQTLAAVFISSALATAITVQFVHVRSSLWFWLGPLAVALFGYVFSVWHPEGWQAGVLHGPLAALARPVPLDYVGMGPAGAILGGWLSRARDQAA
jgi:hypothetical protein